MLHQSQHPSHAWRRPLLYTLGTLFLVYSALTYTVEPDPSMAPVVMSATAKAGKQQWQKHNCTSCHQVLGLGGYLGPDLTNVISRHGDSEGYIRAILHTGTERMPQFQLAPQDVDALVAYLRYIDQAGQFPAQTVEKTWYGSFRLAGRHP